MIQKILINLILVIFSLPIFGQSTEEKQNRVVYNRIEYFFNTQQTDSIYALANENFKTQYSFKKFQTIFDYFYLFGKIKEANQVTYDKGIIGYNLTFADTKGHLKLGVDSTFKFHTFAITDQPYISKDIEEINSNVNKVSKLDFYVDSLAKTYLKDASTASLTIGIVSNNKVNTFLYGETTKGDNLSIPTANSIYELGSLSKIFTAVLLADLVEKKVISLDDSIAKFLPDSVKSNPFIQKITFKQLANHTSGLPRLPSNLEKAPKFNASNPYATYGRTELYSYLAHITEPREPGEEYEYSNFGFGLLGDIINTITKKTYAQNIKEIITVPLGMTNTVERIDPKTQKMVTLYDEKGKQVPSWDFQALAGAGSLKSSINDLLRFTQYQFKLPENNLENAFALTRQFTFYLPPNTDIGLGWHMTMTDGVTSYVHSGATSGSSSFIALIPDLKSAIIVLSNSAHQVDDISSKILEKVLLSEQ